MQGIKRILPIVLLVFATPFLLGSDKCDEGGEGGGFLLRIVYEFIDKVDGLEDRVTDLETCACEGILAPVCGENGYTYINVCEAECRDIGITDADECAVPVCGGNTGLVCEDGSFCETRAGCDDSQIGRCKEVPDTCSGDYEPVCGCDGVTYSNDCERRRAGVALDRTGRCDGSSVECSDNADCLDDEFCSKPSRGEDSCESMGECELRPEACVMSLDPVCGCDGVTYDNECEANASGTSVDHPGACDCGGDDKVVICHFPRGNWKKRHTIEVSPSAVPAHLRHGDYLGECQDYGECNGDHHHHDKHHKHKKDKKHKNHKGDDCDWDDHDDWDDDDD